MPESAFKEYGMRLIRFARHPVISEIRQTDDECHFASQNRKGKDGYRLMKIPAL